MVLTHCNILKSWTYIGAEAEKDDTILFFSNSVSKGGKNVNVHLCCFYQGTCSGESTPMLHPNIYTIKKQTDQV